MGEKSDDDTIMTQVGARSPSIGWKRMRKGRNALMD